jgi:NTE family protein
VKVTTVPPLCPLAVSPDDFSRTHELIELTANKTRHWLDEGGLRTQRVPGGLRPHTC